MKTKQTSKNNKLLFAIKAVANEKIYKMAVRLMNTEGHEATRNYVISMGFPMFQKVEYNANK